MNTISATTKLHRDSLAQHGQGAATAAGLPDFALLLGMALGSSVNNAECGMRNAESGNVSGAAGVVTGGKKKTDQTAQTTQMGLIGPMGPMGSMGSQGSAKPANSETAATDCKVQTKPGTAATPPSAATPASAPAAAQDIKTWNVSELAHHLKAAVGALASGQSGDAAAVSTHPATTAISSAAQAQGDKIRANGTQNLLKLQPGSKTQAAAQHAPAVAAPAGGGAPKNLAQQFFAGADPHFNGQAATQDATPAQIGQILKTAEKVASTDSDHAAAPQTADPDPALIAPATAQPADWAPVAVAEGHTTRMPSMIEQVHQLADYMAERTSGTIGLNDKGVDANLKLYPPDLGGVRVQLSVANDHTTEARFIVERPETAQLLQQNMRSFQQGLESHGMAVSRIEVSVQSSVRPASAGSEGGWKQNSQGFRREESPLGGKEGQTPRRNAKERQSFSEA